MPRQKRQEGESCRSCVSWERIVQRNPDMTVKIEANPVGTCLCGPPTATAVLVPQKGPMGKTSLTMQEFTVWPPSIRADDWCGQFERVVS